MLKLDTNAVILTRDIVWLNKLYWKYMGMTKLKKYQVEEDNNSISSIVELIDNDHEENKDDAGRDTDDDANKKTVEAEITQSEQLVPMYEQQIPIWQHNLQTFYNPSGREDEDNDSIDYGEMAYLSMLEGSIDEPNIFNQAWNHADDNECKFWHQAITKELTDMEKRGVWEIID
jgi:hypothetical protein